VTSLRLFLLLLCAALASCSKSETPQQGASRFFNLCVQGKFAEAYESTADRFQLERSAKYFEARVRELGLDHDIHLQWTEAEIKGRATQLTGAFSVPVEDGKEVTGTLTVTMVNESGGWRVLEVRRPLPGLPKGDDLFQVKARAEDGATSADSRTFLEPVRLVMPTEEQLRKLVETTILRFDACVKARDFKPFYDFVSDRWKFRGGKPEGAAEAAPMLALSDRYMVPTMQNLQRKDFANRDERLTVAALTGEFQGFVDRRVDLTPIKDKKLLLDAPAFITSGGILTLRGTVDTFVFVGVTTPPTPLRLFFNLQYVMEANSWRVFGISLSLKES